MGALEVRDDSRGSMRSPARFLFAVACALAVAACARGRAPREEIPSGYPQWERTTEVKLDYPIPGHEDRFRVIRINPTGAAYAPPAAETKRRWDYPAGTVVVKEIFASSSPGEGEPPVAVTAMIKAPADSRSVGGWLWIMKDLSKPLPNERVFSDRFCVACHANANERHPYGDGNPTEEFRDYLFFPPESAR
ncbi:MAG: cytochrome P460 family protein [Spirochaetaceae bacterium]|nr:cytochrome P460 family protein [Spirochaetaceae bacterium]